MTGLRWGVMGSGGIAGAMTGALQSFGSLVVAVGSARPGAAESFAQEWNLPHAVDSHRAVAEIDEVDVVYVATTNDRHLRNVLDCIELGMPVLCEKPTAVNGGQAQLMLGAASAAGVFVMEGLWMRFQPFLAKVDDLIADGAIGAIEHVAVDFSYPAPTDVSRRWMSRELGGGSLLDLGIYPLSLVHHLVGSPLGFEAGAQVGPTGVDLETSVSSHHAGGATAMMTSSFVSDLSNAAVVSGAEAQIRIHPPFHHSPRVTVERAGEIIAAFDTSYEASGFHFEIAEVERCLLAGLIESPLRPHADTLAVMEWMDAIRRQCGVKFPQDLM